MMSNARLRDLGIDLSTFIRGEIVMSGESVEYLRRMLVQDPNPVPNALYKFTLYADGGIKKELSDTPSRVPLISSAEMDAFLHGATFRQLIIDIVNKGIADREVVQSPEDAP